MSKRKKSNEENCKSSEILIENKIELELFCENTDGQEQQGSGSKTKKVKGLPDLNTRRELAKTYIETQHELWSELKGETCLPNSSAKLFGQMAKNFKNQFLANELVSGSIEGIDSTYDLGAAYLRYSDENSNSRSLSQQLVNVLRRAKLDGFFIPWAYVFADAAVSGTIATRRGYQMVKTLITCEKNNVRRIYIDELGRANRNAIESLALGRLIAHHGKRIIGVSDGFDSENPQSKLMLSIYAMLNEWFVDQLRSKVNRGMDDAFRQGKNIQPPSIGYKLIPLADQEGNQVFDKEGNPISVKAIDEIESEHVVKAFELFAVEKWSKERIAKLFNRLKVGGKQTWDARRIKQMLTRETYIGLECYRMTRRVVDPETGAATIEQRPREEWITRESPHLRILSTELWELTKCRLEETSAAYSRGQKERGKRSEVYPTTLFRPICGDCGSPLILGRSGKYASFCCQNGTTGKHNCSFKGYKSVSIVEDCILIHIVQNFLTVDSLAQIVSKANSHLMELLEKPKQDLTPILREINEVTRNRDRLVGVLEGVGEEGLSSVAEKIRTYEKRLQKLKSERVEMETHNEEPPPPLSSKDVLGMMSDARELLNTDIAKAAPILRKIMSPIVVKQFQEKGMKKPTWIAEFSFNGLALMTELTTSRNCPTSSTWEFLNTSGWTMFENARIRLRKVPKYEILAPKFKRLSEGGASIQSIAAAHRICWKYAEQILKFALTGVRPIWANNNRYRGGEGQKVNYKLISEDVSEFRNKAKLTWPQIKDKFQKMGIDVSVSTLLRAWDYAHPDVVEEAVKQGKRIRRK